VTKGCLFCSCDKGLLCSLKCNVGWVCSHLPCPHCLVPATPKVVCFATFSTYAPAVVASPVPFYASCTVS
jgi:hypothetical protein